MRKIVALLFAFTLLFGSAVPQANAQSIDDATDWVGRKTQDAAGWLFGRSEPTPMSQYQPGYGQYPGLGGLYPPVYDHYQWVDCAEPYAGYVISCRGPRVAGYQRQPHAADGVVGAYDYWKPLCDTSNPTTIQEALPCVNAYISWMNSFQLRRIPGPIPPIKSPWGPPAQHEWTALANQLLQQSGYGR